MENALPQGTGADTARADWIGILSRARADDVENLAAAHLADVDFEWLRAPHVGLVMVRGRAGGTGAQFNLGEMTVTRCSVRLPDGAVGHGYASGRSRRQAGSVAKIVKLEHAWRRLDGRNDDGFQVAPFPG